MPFPPNKAAMIEGGYKYLANKVCPCGADMELWLTPADKTIPMKPMRNDDDPAITHFSDCPMAVQFRKAKR